MIFECKICRNTADNTTYTVKEMEFGTREEFLYVECGSCGCVQIADIPSDMGKYYPAEYFAFKNYEYLAKSRIRRFFDEKRVKYHFTGKNVIGKLGSAWSKPLDYLQWVDNAGLDTSARILDVGCGGGELLLRMYIGGFHNCTGTDPFIQNEITYSNGVRILKKDIRELAESKIEEFDLIMFQHSFEHMDSPAEVLEAAGKLLSAAGTIYIAIPVADSHVWHVYRENWRGLRAPRHFFLHTKTSMTILANRTGLDIYSVTYSSHPAQFMESELYKKGIPSNAPKNEKEIFTEREVAGFTKQTADLDREQKGEAAGYYLRKKINRF